MSDQLSEFVRAVGLASTTVPDMEIDASNPFGMMKQVVAEVDRLRQSEELAWGLIANAYGGDWDKATSEWSSAARRWRDEYHKHLPSRSDKVEKPL
jgi:hypothetical protein